jgi:hypothetical protein
MERGDGLGIRAVGDAEVRIVELCLWSLHRSCAGRAAGNVAVKDYHDFFSSVMRERNGVFFH